MTACKRAATILSVATLIALVVGAADGWILSARAAASAVIAHTSGQVSRKADIQVVFRQPVGGGGPFPKELAASPFAFNPAVGGTAVWTNARTLSFKPRRDWTPGEKVTATLHLADIMETGGPADVEFDFTILTQAIEVRLDGLQATGGPDGTAQRLTGQLTTADVANDWSVEKVLSIMLDGRSRKIAWQHDEDRKTHRFIVDGLRRAQRALPVTIVWDGAPIGAAQKGRRELLLPASGTFDVLYARPVQGAQSAVEIRMTDRLDSGQDLRGLVTVKGEETRTEVAGNRITVYLPTSKWGAVTVALSDAIRNRAGQRLGTAKDVTVTFEEMKPQVRFVGKAVIVPSTLGQTVPVETANLRRLTVSAMRIPADNLAQFLQVNDLDGQREVKRVGRVVWRRVIDLNWQPEMKNRWVRHGLDLSELLNHHPDGMFRLTLSFTHRDVDYGCAGADGGDLFDTAPAPGDGNIDAEAENSFWNSYANTGGYDNWYRFYDNRENPCHPAYYMRMGDHDITVARNILVSDIGLIAKRGDTDELLVVATDVRSALPLPRVSVDVLDYQQQVLARGRTDNDGRLTVRTGTTPFLAVARHGGQWGYLKLDGGSANSLSHFDVAGAAVTKGIKGFIYGERGVWRPGDTLHLTFILDDHDNPLPDNHPVRFELINPKGLLVRTMTRTRSLNGFYDFATPTAAEAPTGNWVGRVTVGGAVFEKRLKIETVMPNRLKIEVDFGDAQRALKNGPLSGEIHSKWLHGAPAGDLEADMEMRLVAGKTVFPGYDIYTFDDPVRRFRAETFDIFKGTLDGNGRAAFSADVSADNASPGMLAAVFQTRVFEPSGAFSTDVYKMPFHPYARYVGVRLPKGDAARGMLLTDTDHTVDIAMVDSTGKPVPEGRVQVTVYKLKWRWWWEKGREDLADYVGKTSYDSIDVGEAAIRDGKGQWRLRIDYPAWGRYLVRVADMDGNHMTGKIVYVDWPGWAGRGQKESPGGASVLSFSSDKPAYNVGEKIVLTIPAGRNGRGLVSIEKGGRVLHTDWVEGGETPIRYEVAATPEMAPNVYAHVTYLQPHRAAVNDLPIRLYGVVPIAVEDPQTRLSPVIETPETFAPEAEATLSVSETHGRSMTYTLAIVDEGLLDLTRFATPDPWSRFYAREALSVKTWDLFDDVAGAYGGVLEQLLAVGGGAPVDEGAGKKARRFPPMVRFAGPFFLEAGAAGRHTIDFPQYIGSVRVMVVAGGDKRAYGFAEKAVPVKKPLMVLATLPRVVSPEETVALPVTVFALDPAVTGAAVRVTAGGALSTDGDTETTVAFPAIGDRTVSFHLKAGAAPGPASVVVSAVSGIHTAAHRIDIPVRSVTRPVTTFLDGVISPEGSWAPTVTLPGVAGTNTVGLEVSALPTMRLGDRLAFLVHYPHGCLEQTVSTAFPQLYLHQLAALSPAERNRIAEHVQAAIDKLGRFLDPAGGFAYWPGGRQTNAWADIYTGHFLHAAKTAGYLVPGHLTMAWQRFNRQAARNWVMGPDTAQLTQAYRLYVLALAGAPEMGAMNRLREASDLSTAARWRLAAAYGLAGQPEAADRLTAGAVTQIPEYTELSETFGSALRDEAMILESLSLAGRMAEADRLAKHIGARLGAPRWYSTQTVAYAFIALAQYAGLSSPSAPLDVTYRAGSAESHAVSAPTAVFSDAIDPKDLGAGAPLVIHNTGKRTLYAHISLRGNPAPGNETAAASGLALNVRYLDLNDAPLNVDRLQQGTDLVIEVDVRHTGNGGDYANLALTHLLPAGWEITHARLTGDAAPAADTAAYRDVRDDRELVYFDLARGDTAVFRTRVNAGYVGRFYLPAVHVAAMYDERIFARTPGRWIDVTGAP